MFKDWLRLVWQDRQVRALLAAGLAIHVILALSFNLSPDEAHYALYGSRPDWSYFDHPPMVGWLQMPFAALGGHDLLMRVVPMLCWVLAALGLLRLAQELFGKGLSRWVLMLLLLSPMPHLLGLALVPDTLLMPLVCATMLVCWRLCDPAQVHQRGLWLLLGLCLGLAGLSKYTAVLLALGVVLALLLVHGPRPLLTAGPWMAVLVALVLITPVLGWNATHGWISFAYQVNHAAGASEWLLRRVGAFVLVQLLSFGLLLVAGLLVLARRQAVVAPVSDTRLSALRFSLCFGLPPLLLYAWLSGRGSTLPHWATPAWLALLPAAAAGCRELWGRKAWLVRTLAVFQGASCVVLAVLMLSAGVASETGAQAQSAPGKMLDTAPRNPFADLHGWREAAQQARVLAERHQVGTLAVMNWSLASRLAWYARPVPVKVVNRHFDQFDLWFGTLQPGESVLLVDWSLMSFEPPVGPKKFRQCELLDQQATRVTGRQVAHFNFMLCSGWQGPQETPLGARS